MTNRLYNYYLVPTIYRYLTIFRIIDAYRAPNPFVIHDFYQLHFPHLYDDDNNSYFTAPAIRIWVSSS
jgi:hypothetical protein